MRLLCLLFPRFGLSLVRRQRPVLADRTLVMLQGHGEDALVTSATCDASARGLLPGMTAAEARRRLPDARFLPDNAGDSLDQLERVADIIRRRATPLVEIAGREHLFVDITRLTHGPREEAALAESLARLATTWTECPVRAAVASTRREALDAARTARATPVICPPATFEADRPIAPYRPEVIAVGLEAPSEPVLRARLGRTFRHLDTVLGARNGSFRSVDLVVTDATGDRELSLRLRQPEATTAVVARTLLELPAVLAGATAVHITLGQLGPDVRVRPCTASAAHRPVQRSHRRRQVLLRAS
ncbi:MAG: hypothetical protein M0R74_12445 [Dehalococcoidia bacterium]|nr:hypothetical protein [Dehalococcoidia bacterium]